MFDVHDGSVIFRSNRLNIDVPPALSSSLSTIYSRLWVVLGSQSFQIKLYPPSPSSSASGGSQLLFPASMQPPSVLLSPRWADRKPGPQTMLHLPSKPANLGLLACASIPRRMRMGAPIQGAIGSLYRQSSHPKPLLVTRMPHRVGMGHALPTITL
jgi:hypothetical protein